MRLVGKKIMILGAGIYQVSGIRAARALGLYTITVDYLPGNVGHRLSHRYVDASTTDPERVLACARELGIDGIVTFASDVAVASAAHVAEQLNLPGCGAAVARAMCNKARFREIQREHGLDAPRFAAGRSAEELVPLVAALRPPLVVKPVDTSGSRGIARVDRVDREAWEPAFTRALGFSGSGEVCIEELMDGIDVTGEGFLRDGRLDFAAFTRKHRRDFVVLGHEWPARLSEREQRVAHDAIAAACRALDYRDGPFDVDLIVGRDRATIIEMAPRTGGNGIPPLLARATGFDLHEAAVLAAVGEHAGPPKVTAIPAGSMVIGAPHPGLLTEMASEAELRARAPQVIEYITTYRPGDEVSALEHGGASLGYCVFERSGGETWDEAAHRVTEALAIAVRGDSATAAP